MTTRTDATRDEHVLEVRNLVKAFGAQGERTPAIDGLSFSARRGESLAIVGPSGCGKTTLLRMLAGLGTPDSGEVVFEGAPVSGPTSGMGLVFQEYTRSLFPWLSVSKNVAFGLKGHSAAERASRVTRILGAVGLADRARAYPWQLSGGMQQRVALARALVVQPSLLLLDEPFGSVDAQTRMALQQEVSRLLRALNVTSLLVTHDIDEAVLMGDRVLVLSARPARIVGEVVIDDIEWPRDPVTTKERSVFLEHRRRVFELLDVPMLTRDRQGVETSKQPGGDAELRERSAR